MYIYACGLWERRKSDAASGRLANDEREATRRITLETTRPTTFTYHRTAVHMN